MADEKNVSDRIPIDPAQPETKSNVLMVVAILSFLAIAGCFVAGVADDPPETVEEATEVVP
jgi:hypothetical protein